MKIQISQIKINLKDIREKVNEEKQLLINKVSALLKLNKDNITDLIILRRSYDFRYKPELFYVYSVEVSLVNTDAEKLIRRLKNNNISVSQRKEYKFPYTNSRDSAKERPIIIGTGPAGLFCGYMLAMNGFAPILLERGEPVEVRTKTVERFFENGLLNPESNVQFGEGGAGTFSDGKLNTLVKDKDGRNRAVLSVFCDNGAPEEIMYDSKAHIGTDELKNVIVNMRKKMLENGADIRFNARVTDFIIKNNEVSGVVINGTEILEGSMVIVAIGHSARDTFPILLDKGLQMEPKDFAVGLRVMHPQSLINQSQYGACEDSFIGAAPYKLTGDQKDGSNNVYSFCMCPGGYVVNASSESGHLAVNGMSYHSREGDNANSAIIMTVKKEMFEDKSPLGGISFQRDLEKKAYELNNGDIPVQEYKDFYFSVKGNHVSYDEDTDCYYESFKPAILGNYKKADLTQIFPAKMNELFVDGMESFARKIKGFNHPKTILAGVESRTSSPIRLLRDENLESNVKGLYPCGEGAGYAGGITSAAMDGIRVAEFVAKKLEMV